MKPTTTRSNGSLKLYVAAYVVSLSGSVFGAVSIFLSIEKTFGSIQHLSLALALKTLFFGLVAPSLVKLMRSFGLWQTLIWTQVLGAVFSLVMIFAFDTQNFPLTLAMIVLAGLPNASIALANPVLFREMLDDSGFRKLQGRIGLASSGILLVAGLTAQFVLLRYGLKAVLVYDALTYLVAFLAFFVASKSFKTGSDKDPQPQNTDALWTTYKKSFAAKGALTFYILVASIYLYKGVYPMVSGSSNATFADHVLPVFRESLWSLEALSGIFASLLYIRLTKLRTSRSLLFLGSLSSAFLIPVAFFPGTTTLAIGFFLIGLCMQFGFQNARDTFLLEAPDRSSLEERSATISAASNFMMTLSPLILGTIMLMNDISCFVATALAIQVVLMIFYMFRTRIQSTLR